MAPQKITQQVVNDIVAEVVGEDSLAIIDFLKDKKNISDFKIAEKVDRDIHEVRNILYWTFNKKRVKDLISNLKKQKLEKFQSRLKQEEDNQGNFYICPNACIRVGFERATDLEYRCPECASLLNHQDNAKTIEFLKTKIREMSTNGIRA